MTSAAWEIYLEYIYLRKPFESDLMKYFDDGVLNSSQWLIVLVPRLFGTETF